jgi:hypothetical protein
MTHTDPEVLTFHDIQECKRRRVWTRFRETAVFHEKRDACCFLYEYNEPWFHAELTTGGWAFRVIPGGVMVGLKGNCYDHEHLLALTPCTWVDFLYGMIAGLFLSMVMMMLTKMQ